MRSETPALSPTRRGQAEGMEFRGIQMGKNSVERGSRVYGRSGDYWGTRQGRMMDGDRQTRCRGDVINDSHAGASEQEKIEENRSKRGYDGPMGVYVQGQSAVE